MTLLSALAMPPRLGLPAAYRLVKERIALRWHEGRDTTSLEIVLFGAALVIGIFFACFPSGFRQGWSMLAPLIPVRTFGIVVLVKAFVRAASIYHGCPKYRSAVSWFGLFFDGAVVLMIWAGNHFSPVVPFATPLPLMNLYIMGRFAKVAHRAPA